MNKAALSEFWYKKHNKVFAVGFSSIALVLFFAYYLTVEILFKWTFFQSDISQLWNFFVYLVVYLIILIGNIRNDSIAYQGILMFVCYKAFDSATTIVRSGRSVIETFQGEWTPLYLLYGISWLAVAGVVFLGIFLYVRSYQYLKGSFNHFIEIRILAILFAVCLFLSISFTLFLVIAGGYSNSIMLFFLLDFADIAIGIATIFTMERLRRN
ncbi:MAG: hypothetical protein BWY98_00092 [Tenericutes bacterium ADurb.BinA155]|jgi:hypothetical protein|nr:MAG: hypothetical protein BWY98_00092 [Tenericutes bacterium ADurb.BinA155]